MAEQVIRQRILQTPVVRSMNEESRTVEFVASDNSVDSYGTVIPVDKWDLRRYQANGIVGYQHDVYGQNGSDPDDIIGRGEAFVEGDQLIVRVTFEPAELNEKADKIFRKIMFGSLRGVSVGFQPTAEGHWGDKRNAEDPEVYYYDGQELLEVSVVNIPSNANAVRRSMEMEREANGTPAPAVEEVVEEVAEEKAVEAPAEEPVADNSYIVSLAKASVALANI